MFYATKEEYYEAHKKDRYNYGDKWLPKIHIKSQKRTLKLRRSVAIHAYVGANGSGKSLAMVHDTIPTLNGIRWECDNEEHFHFKAYGQTSGWRRILSTVRLLDPRTGEDHPLFLPYYDHRQLLTIERADVLMDEITGVASAYEAMSMPTQVNNVLMQLRRRDATLRWTTPNWAAAAKRIREVTKAVTFCKGSIPIYETGRTWASNCKFLWKTYDAGNFESFTVGVRDRLLPETYENYFRPFKHNLAENLYETLAEVLAISANNNQGMCVHCGGKRSIEKCNCVRDEVDTDENYFRINHEMLEAHRMEHGGVTAAADEELLYLNASDETPTAPIEPAAISHNPFTFA